jgi:hypothetical protein
VTDITPLLEGNHAALDDLLRTAEAAATQGRWTTPRAPGKWSPQQVVEHVAMAYEEGGKVIAGLPSKLPTLPAIVRPLARIFFNRVVRTGKFHKAKTNREMDPAQTRGAGPAGPAEARARLNDAFAKFEEACRACAASGGRVPSGAFGSVALEDHARFTELHTRHHTKQIPIVL